MFNNRSRWRHRSCLDIDIVVVQNHGANGFKTTLEVLYWNRHYNGPAYPGTEEVYVKHEDSVNWTLIKEKFL